MTPFAYSLDFSYAYPGEHSRQLDPPGSSNQHNQATPFSSSSGSSNHFDTPDESTSCKTTSGSGEDEFNNHNNSINSQGFSEGFPSDHGTINPAMLTLGYPSSGSQDIVFTQSSSTSSGTRSTQDVAQPTEDSMVEGQGGMSSPYGEAVWGDLNRRFQSKPCRIIAL